MKLETQEVSVKEIELGGPIKNYNYHSDESIQELTDNIKKIGLINPIIVWWNYDKDCYHVAAGERRFRAIKRLNWEKVEAKVIDPSGDKDILQYQVSENRMREYSWLIEARQIYELMSGEDGKSTSFVADLFNLSKSGANRKRKMGQLLDISEKELEDFLEPRSDSTENNPIIKHDSLDKLAEGLLRPNQPNKDRGDFSVEYNPFSQQIIDQYLDKALKETWNPDRARAEMKTLELKKEKEKLKEKEKEYEEKIESQVSEKLKEKTQEIKEEARKKLQKEISGKKEELNSLKNERDELEESLIEAQEQDSEEVGILKDKLDKLSDQRKELEEKKKKLQKELKQEKDRELSEKEKEKLKQELRPKVEKEIEEQLQERKKGLEDKREEILKKEEELEEKEQELSDQEETIKKKEEDLEQRILKPKQHHRRIVKDISELRGDLSSVDSAWLNLLDKSELDELIEQFKNLQPDVQGVINLITEVKNNGSKSTKSIEGSKMDS